MEHGAALDARPRWPGVLRLVAPLGVLTAASWLGTVSAPALVSTSPLLLMALSPRLIFLVIAAGEVPAAAYLAVGLARLMVADPFHYLIGRHGSDRLSESMRGWSSAARRIHDAACNAIRCAGSLAVVLRPNGAVLCAAGACRLRPRIVAAADVVGTTGYLGVVWFGGSLLAPESINLSMSLAGVLVVIGLAALAGVVAEHRRRHGRGRRAAAVRGTHPCVLNLAQGPLSGLGGSPSLGAESLGAAVGGVVVR